MDKMLFQKSVNMSVGRAQNEGEVTIGGKPVPCSAPAVMNGKGVGTNPEELLVSAVAACYSLTFAGVLQARKLPADGVQIDAEGVVIRDKGLKFERISVSPVIHGADPNRGPEYQAAAETARERCFIGSTVKKSLDYVLGTVTLAERRNPKSNMAVA